MVGWWVYLDVPVLITNKMSHHNTRINKIFKKVCYQLLYSNEHSMNKYSVIEAEKSINFKDEPPNNISKSLYR